MKNYTNFFGNYHPVCQAIYFISFFFFMIAINNPAHRVVATIIIFVYVILLKGVASIGRSLLYIIPLLIIISVLNPIFNHIGQTVLFYLNDEPISLEAVLFGFFSAVLIVSLVQFFTAFGICLNAHKLRFLLGRALPAISLMISMVLRYVPHLRRRLKEILAVQSTLGLDSTKGRLKTKLSTGSTVLLGLMSLSMEEGIDTSDSMNARGYYLRGKTHFHTYHYRMRDFICIIAVFGLDILLIIPLFMGVMDYDIYPIMTPFIKSNQSFFAMVVYAFLAAIPMLANILEEIRWRLLKRKI